MKPNYEVLENELLRLQQFRAEILKILNIPEFTPNEVALGTAQRTAWDAERYWAKYDHDEGVFL